MLSDGEEPPEEGESGGEGDGGGADAGRTAADTVTLDCLDVRDCMDTDIATDAVRGMGCNLECGP